MLAVNLACALAQSMAGAATVASGGPESEWRLSQLNRKVWQIEDGLPHNYVTAIAADDRGYLLVGTQSGIARFDGAHFTAFEHLGGMWTYALLRASDNAVWVGSYQSGLHVIRNGRVEFYGPAELAGAVTVYSLLEDRSHAIWAATEEGLLRCAPGRPQLVQKGINAEGYAWQSVAEDDAGAIWFAASDGLFRVSGGRVRKMRLDGVRGFPVTIYQSSGSHQLHLGTTLGLYLLKCFRDTCEATAVPRVTGPVVGLLSASDHALWIATWGNGIFRCQGRRLERLSTREGLADDFVRVLSEDSEHNLWAGTRSGGLTRFRKTPLRPWGLPEGLGGNYASALVDDAAGGLWLGTWRSGLFHWRDGTIVQQLLPEPALRSLITTLAVDAARDLWAGTSHGRLWKLPQGSTTVDAVPLPAGEGPINSILAAYDGTLWLGRTGSGLAGFASGDPRTSAPIRFLPGETVWALLEDRERRLWIGARGGLWRLSAAPGRRLTTLREGSVTALARDRRGRVWVAKAGGQVEVFAGDAATPMVFAGLPAPDIYLMADDTRGSIWFGTGRGLAKADMGAVEKYLTGRRTPIEVSVYGISEGMRTIECRIGAQPGIFVRSDASVWLPTAKGFLEIVPTPEPVLPPPRPWIERMQVDGKTVAVDAPIRLSPGTHELTAGFTAVRLGRAERVRFRYRISGLDDDWVDAGEERSARYGHLRPGQFRLLVSARDPDGEWSPAVTSGTIEQAPLLYKTGWFRVLGVAVAGAAAAALYRLRLRAMRRRYAAVLEERNRIAREWHDTLLAGLSAAAWQLDVAAGQARESQALASIRSALGMVRHCRAEARLAIGDLRHQHVETMSLGESLERAIGQLAENAQAPPRLEIEGRVPLCSDELNSDLLGICQEATANALRHAQATEIVVRLVSGDGKLCLSVEDDGIGIDAAMMEHPPNGHYGLLGMQERARRQGGELHLSSAPGKGTVVRAVVPLKS